MITLDYKDTRPLYEQIAEKFQNLILKGVLTQDEQLPSVRSLAIELSINPNTIQRAYAELEREGFIYTVKGRGGFVCYQENLLNVRKEKLRERIRAVLKEAQELNIPAEELFEGIFLPDKAPDGKEPENPVEDVQQKQAMQATWHNNETGFVLDMENAPEFVLEDLQLTKM